MSDQDGISPNNINTTSSRQVTRIKKDINYQLLQTNIIKIVQQTFSKENCSLYLGNEWVYSKKFISQHLMINQFSPLADTHLLVWISFYILMTYCIFVEIEFSVKRGLLLIACLEVKELNWE